MKVDDAAPTPAVAGSGSATVAAASDATTTGVDPQALVAYRFALVRGVSKRYPGYAQERGWSGTAEIRVWVGRDGQAREIALARSSGYGQLDDEARSMIEGAARRAVVPGLLRGREFDVKVPVIFELHDSAQVR